MAEYYFELSDEERGLAELWSKNWFEQSGRPMNIPPRLYEDLRKAGVSMKYFRADKNAEARGDVEQMRKEGLLWNPEHHQKDPS